MSDTYVEALLEMSGHKRPRLSLRERCQLVSEVRTDIEESRALHAAASAWIDAACRCKNSSSKLAQFRLRRNREVTDKCVRLSSFISQRLTILAVAEESQEDTGLLDIISENRPKSP